MNKKVRLKFNFKEDPILVTAYVAIMKLHNRKCTGRNVSLEIFVKHQGGGGNTRQSVIRQRVTGSG